MELTWIKHDGKGNPFIGIDPRVWVKLHSGFCDHPQQTAWLASTWDSKDALASNWAGGSPAHIAEFAIATKDGWIEWGGGECPVRHGFAIETILRDGDEARWACASHLDDWTHTGRACDIVRFRLVPAMS